MILKITPIVDKFRNVIDCKIQIKGQINNNNTLIRITSHYKNSMDYEAAKVIRNYYGDEGLTKFVKNYTVYVLKTSPKDLRRIVLREVILDNAT